MKKLIQLMAAVKMVASLAFTAGMMIVALGAMLLGEAALPVGIIWQAVFLALLFGFLQFLAFSESAFPRMGTAGRMVLLGVSTLVVLAVFAAVFRWFPLGSVVNWLLFVGLYVAVFCISALVLRFVFRLGGLKYDEMLTAYKTRHTGECL